MCYFTGHGADILRKVVSKQSTVHMSSPSHISRPGRPAIRLVSPVIRSATLLSQAARSLGQALTSARCLAGVHHLRPSSTPKTVPHEATLTTPLAGTGAHKHRSTVDIHHHMRQVCRYTTSLRLPNQIRIDGSHRRSWDLRGPVTRGGFMFALCKTQTI